MYRFHRPLHRHIRIVFVFFMSGYCFKDKYLDDALAFIKAFYGNILALPEMVASVPAFT